MYGQAYMYMLYYIPIPCYVSIPENGREGASFASGVLPLLSHPAGHREEVQGFKSKMGGEARTTFDKFPEKVSRR